FACWLLSFFCLIPDICKDFSCGFIQQNRSLDFSVPAAAGKHTDSHSKPEVCIVLLVLQHRSPFSVCICFHAGLNPTLKNAEPGPASSSKRHHLISAGPRVSPRGPVQIGSAESRNLIAETDDEQRQRQRKAAWLRRDGASLWSSEIPSRMTIIEGFRMTFQNICAAVIMAFRGVMWGVLVALTGCPCTALACKLTDLTSGGQ
ncbi:hypothetical protein XENOCAPTIV_001533, partial [Xenoophorus captivus]